MFPNSHPQGLTPCSFREATTMRLKDDKILDLEEQVFQLQVSACVLLFFKWLLNKYK